MAAIDQSLFRSSPPPSFPRFDVHLTVTFRGATSDDLPPQRVAELGLAGGAVMADGAGARDALLQWTNTLSGRWLPFVRVRSAADAADLTGFAGVKLTPDLDGTPSRTLLDRLAASGLPLLIHAGAAYPPSRIARKILPHLSNSVILAHLGSWPCSADDLQQAVALAVSDERVFLETSGACIAGFISYAAQRAPRKLLFGSNAPFCDPDVQWGHVSSAVNDDGILENIAHRNSVRLFSGDVTS